MCLSVPSEMVRAECSDTSEYKKIRKDDNCIGSCGVRQVNKSCLLGANEATLSSVVNNKASKAGKRLQ